MSEDVLEVTKEQFEAFIKLPSIAATYTYYVSKPEVLPDVPRSLLGRRWIRYAGIYYVVGEFDGNKKA